MLTFLNNGLIKHCCKEIVWFQVLCSHEALHAQSKLLVTANPSEAGNLRYSSWVAILRTHYFHTSSSKRSWANDKRNNDVSAWTWGVQTAYSWLKPTRFWLFWICFGFRYHDKRVFGMRLYFNKNKCTNCLKTPLFLFIL